MVTTVEIVCMVTLVPYGAPRLDVSRAYASVSALICVELPLWGQFALAYSALKSDKATAQIPNIRIVAERA